MNSRSRERCWSFHEALGGRKRIADFSPITVTITSKGQSTIPLKLRQRLHLNPGDRLKFDEVAPFLSARRAVDRKGWDGTTEAWRTAAALSFQGHPWKKLPSARLMDELRGGPVDPENRSPGE